MIERTADLDGDRRDLLAEPGGDVGGIQLRQQLERELLIAPEAVQWLRLDEGRTMRLALRALARLVDSGRLARVIVGKRRRYPLVELRRFLERELEKASDR